MYEGHFHLERRPFVATPDAHCCYLAPSWEPQFQALLRCIELGQGIGILTGSPGMGKTLLDQVILAEFEGRFVGVYLGTGQFPSRRALLQTILYELGQSYGGMTDQELRLELNTSLRALINRTNGLLLVLDEAHLLSDRLLEEVRLLADLAQHGVPLARVVLSGNPEFEERLTAPGLSAFNQRVACQVALEALSRAESLSYLERRIEWAGGQPETLFERSALELIAQASDGVPRCLNQLADHSLTQAFLARAPQVTESTVRAALEGLQHLPLRWNPSSLLKLGRSRVESPHSETSIRTQVGNTSANSPGNQTHSWESPMPASTSSRLSSNSQHRETQEHANAPASNPLNVHLPESEMRPAGIIRPETAIELQATMAHGAVSATDDTLSRQSEVSSSVDIEGQDEPEFPTACFEFGAGADIEFREHQPEVRSISVVAVTLATEGEPTAKDATVNEAPVAEHDMVCMEVGSTTEETEEELGLSADPLDDLIESISIETIEEDTDGPLFPWLAKTEEEIRKQRREETTGSNTDDDFPRFVSVFEADRTSKQQQKPDWPTPDWPSSNQQRTGRLGLDSVNVDCPGESSGHSTSVAFPDNDGENREREQDRISKLNEPATSWQPAWDTVVDEEFVTTETLAGPEWLEKWTVPQISPNRRRGPTPLPNSRYSILNKRVTGEEILTDKYARIDSFSKAQIWFESLQRQLLKQAHQLEISLEERASTTSVVPFQPETNLEAAPDLLYSKSGSNSLAHSAFGTGEDDLESDGFQTSHLLIDTTESDTDESDTEQAEQNTISELAASNLESISPVDRIDVICELIEYASDPSRSSNGVDLVTDTGVEHIDSHLPTDLSLNSNAEVLSGETFPADPFHLEDWIGTTVVNVGRDFQHSSAINFPDLVNPVRASQLSQLLDGIERVTRFDIVEPETVSDLATETADVDQPRPAEYLEAHREQLQPPAPKYQNLFSMLRRRKLPRN